MATKIVDELRIYCTSAHHPAHFNWIFSTGNTKGCKTCHFGRNTGYRKVEDVPWSPRRQQKVLQNCKKKHLAVFSTSALSTPHACSSYPELWAAEAHSHTTQQSTSTNPEYNQSWRKRTSRPLSRLKLLKFLLQAEDESFYCQRCFYMNSWISRAFPRARARKATFTVLFGVLEVT
jgi:hypothetical protein